MTQTDRQTDKATHWKSAIFDEGLDANEVPWSGQWSRLDTLPPFVKEVHRQKEICPETQRPHFQVHIVCHRQVRRTQLSEWIKHTKWLPVTGEQHIKNSINYCKKADSAVPGTHEVVQGERYYQLHELLQELAKYSEPELKPTDFLDVDPKRSVNAWKWITQRKLERDITWANRFSNPTLRRMWEDWGSLFIKNWEDGGSYIIEDPPQDDEDPFGSECFLSEV